MSEATATVDVNDAFRPERIGQIAAAYRERDAAAARFAERAAAFDARVEAGEIRDNGNGTYTSLTGYDRGEVWTIQRQPGQIPLILPQSGLDIVDGKAQLYTAVPAWHELGNVIPGGTTDIADVLRLGGIDFTIVTIPHAYDWKGERIEAAGGFDNVGSDTGFLPSVAGSRYTAAQPREQLTFLQELAERFDVPFESAGPLNGGKQVFVSMRVPDSMVVDAGGINEQIPLFLVCINPND